MICARLRLGTVNIDTACQPTDKPPASSVTVTRNTLGRYKRHMLDSRKTREREAMLKRIRELDAEIASAICRTVRLGCQ